MHRNLRFLRTPLDACLTNLSSDRLCSRGLRGALVGWMILCVLFPNMSNAADGIGNNLNITKSKKAPNPANHARLVDLTLSEEGMITGRITTPSHEAVPHVEVKLRGTHGSVLTTQADALGGFQIGPTRGGMHVIESCGTVYQIRAWAAGTAPPSALALMELSVEPTVRAQSAVGEFMASDPFLLSAFIAGAIAIPLAVYGNRHDSHPSGS